MRTFSKLTLLAAVTLVSAAAIAAPTDIHPAANPSNSTWTNGVSSDGLTSVGYSDIGGGAKAFKIVGSSLTTLSPLSGHSNAVALAASANGSLVVGFSIDGSSYNQAVSWNGTTATALDSTASFLFSEATSISSTGATIVGWGFSGTTFREEAFYHRAGSINNFSIQFSTYASKALGVSADGNTIVGSVADNYSTPSTASGFVYVVGGTSTIVDAGLAIPAFNTAGLIFTQLTAISGNGAIAIGYASSSLNPAMSRPSSITSLAPPIPRWDR
jgi:uncharacterized membrane protein